MNSAKSKTNQHTVWFFISLVIIMFIILSWFLLLRFPAVWPDEAIYADIVSNILKHKRLATNIWGNTIPGIKKYALWNPPLFFWLIAVWETIFGSSIKALRFLSLTSAVVLMIVWYWITLIKKRTVSPAAYKQIDIWFWLFTAGFSIDHIWLKGSHILRPEIFVLLSGFLAIYIWLSWKQNTTLQIVAVGILTGMAFWLHYFVGSLMILVMLTAIVINTIKSKYAWQYLGNFILGLSIVLFAWLIWMWPNRFIFLKQLITAAQRKNIEPTWLWTVMQSSPTQVQLIYLAYLIASIVIIVKIWSTNNIVKLKSLITSWLVLFWLGAIYGKQFWYYIMPIPMIYLGLWLIFRYESNKSWRLGIKTLIISLVVLNTNLLTTTIRTSANMSYYVFGQKINRLIPKNARVFLSSIPDPYFTLRNNGVRTIYEFPVLHTNISLYRNLLNKSDYIIYSGNYSKIVFGTFLEKYIKKHSNTILYLNNAGGYRVAVIKLKK